MPRSAAITPNYHLHTTLPPELARRLQDYLWSDSEGRVPKAAYQTFFTARIQEYFSLRQVDLAPWLNTNLGECVVSGTDASIARLIKHLQNQHASP